MKLTYDEKIILKNVDKKFKYIVRDINGHLCISDKKPIKVDICWLSFITSNFSAFDKLFQFITWEDSEPWLIEDLLKEE